MPWIVQIPIRGRKGIEYERHGFMTKKDAERFRNSLQAYSEIYKLTKLR